MGIYRQQVMFGASRLFKLLFYFLWLLVLTWLLSTFLDNIAAAVIGGVMAKNVFNNRVTVGYLAAIVSAANAGGAGSVIGAPSTC